MYEYLNCNTYLNWKIKLFDLILLNIIKYLYQNLVTNIILQ